MKVGDSTVWVGGFQGSIGTSGDQFWVGVAAQFLLRQGGEW